MIEEHILIMNFMGNKMFNENKIKILCGNNSPIIRNFLYLPILTLNWLIF